MFVGDCVTVAVLIGLVVDELVDTVTSIVLRDTEEVVEGTCAASIVSDPSGSQNAISTSDGDAVG